MAHLAKIGFGILLTVIGLVVGRFLAGSSGASTHEGLGEEAPAAAGPKVIPPQTLKSMGVTVDKARRGDFVLTRKVQAVVADRPLNQRPVTAPLGGIVTRIHTRTGSIVKAGEPLVTMVRDPISRPKPELTADVLKPVSEDVHETAARLRLARSAITVTQQELERIAPFIEDRTIPGKTAIDLRYALARSEQEAQNARTELKAHGLTEAEIDAVAAGAAPPRMPSLWRRALQENGLWIAKSEALWQTVPEEQRGLPWCVAAVGELTAAGLVTPELVAFLQNVKEAPRRFSEIAGLLLQGSPLATVQLLLLEGALEPELVLRAPRADAPDWDVEEILVRPGQRLEPGAIAVRVHDGRLMWLELQPVGQEMGVVARAIEDGAPLKATPLVAGSGPALDGVRLERLAMQGADDARGGLATALVENIPLACGTAVLCRSWQLRVGLRYMVQVPVERWEKRFVLPAAAVTQRGADRIVFIQNGSTFTPQPVTVEYTDDEIAVIADDGSIYEDDPGVMSGAFALGLALDTGPQAADPHAGHNHG